MRRPNPLASLIGSFFALAFAVVPLPAHAVPMNVLKVVDLNGNLLTDLDGNPTIATLAESPFPGGTTAVSFEIIVPDVVPFSTAGQVSLIEIPPDPVTNRAPLSDLVNGQLLFSTATVPALLVVQLRTFTAPRQIVTCQTVGVGQCLLENGGFQDVTPLLFPGRTTSFRVLVQSDPTPAVPEPGTLMLLGMGLGGIAALARRGG